MAYSDRRSPAAARAFAAALLFTFGDETGLLDGLPLLRVGLLPADAPLLAPRPAGFADCVDRTSLLLGSDQG
jgi:hypothetical protein